MTVLAVKSKRYKVWLDEGAEFPEEGAGWHVILETDDKEEAETKAESYHYAYYEDTFE